MFKSKLGVLTVLAAGLMLVAGTAFAGLADPCQSSATSAGGHVLSCPQGDGQSFASAGATISVTILDNLGNPIPGIPASDFWLESCDAAHTDTLCSGMHSVDADSMTNAAGQTTISDPWRMGGCALNVIVVCQGVTIGSAPGCPNRDCLSVASRSVDLDADNSVGLTDFTAFSAVYLTSDQCADFDAAGGVGITDFTAFTAHYFHSCN
jgi:hypothetical protein